VKVVLSRKGFDTTWGGGASPILPDGRMLSLPIPERAGVSEARYGSLRDVTGTTYLELVRSLYPRSGFRVGGERQELGDGTCAHLDPDLVRSVRPRDRAWRGLFGQARAAASHLLNQDVGPGDLFLFWGRFRPGMHGDDGRLRFVPGTDAFHAIWGYLQVASVLDAGARDSVPWARHHPHFAFPDRGRPNVVFTARRELTFGSGPGWGVFRWHERLRLTAPGSATAGAWLLPALFAPSAGVVVTHLVDPGLWTSNGKAVAVRVVGQKQELVVTECAPVSRWARELVRCSDTWGG
jgi:Nucleotide modification associated domain 3